jgi:hypothetical protein
MPSLVVVACFLPCRAKELSAPPRKLSSHEGGKVVRPTHRPPLPPQEIFLVMISVRD